MITLDINQIKKLKPQRYPILLIDKIVDLEPGKRVVAIKNVSVNEPFFEGHFPDEPVMPGTSIIEAMAQASIFLFYEPEKKLQKLNFFLGVVKDARFFKTVLPGDELKIVGEAVRISGDSGYIKVSVMVESNKICEGELICVRKKT
jgi:3-hydroxyacyl-[acyl-carrier-protein] dehydratase